ncbi:MAG: Enoyl-[acyl-carrier-protein] reductase [NADH] FabI [Planctomycetes bacterium]|nr:Enoyl-[acyl-carrier-protein] reductase [NADH] FabI [Planctomycetota bacterium]
MLAGKKGLVLGVANKRSLAFACARACAERGAEVALTCQNERFEQGARDLAATLPGASATAPVFRCDVTRDEDIASLTESIRSRWERVDFLVHSIAFANPEELKGRFRDTSRPGFSQALDISCYSLVAVARAVAPLMPSGGSVVTLSYLGGERVVPNYNVMGVAKAALDCAVRYLAYDLGPSGIRVNSVLPGPIRTLSASGVGDFSKMLDHVEQVSPMRRNVAADEVGDVVAFLASDMARGVTGAMIHVDAGYSVMGVAIGAPKDEETKGGVAS